jgi:hypothetical protein
MAKEQKTARELRLVSAEVSTNFNDLRENPEAKRHADAIVVLGGGGRALRGL